LVYLSFFMSFFALLAVAYFYWKFRRRQQLSTDQLSSRISSLLAEFNSVSATNVDLLDDRINELRRVVELADLKAKKLNRLVDSVEGTTKSLSKFRAASVNPAEEASKSRREKVIELARQGCGAQEIARRTGIRKGEVSVILRLNRSRVSG